MQIDEGDIVRMKKKAAIIFLISTLAMTCFAGCGNKNEGDVTPTPTTPVQATETPAPTEEPTTAPSETSAPTEAPTAAPTEAPAVTGDISETKVTLGQYKGLTLHEVDSEEVAKELLALLEQFTELVAVDRAAVEGDTVNINYVGKKDGVPFDGGTDDSEAGYNLVLGSGSFIDGFEEGLVGAVAGEVRDLNLTFPEVYHSEELAGQSVVFTVTVNSVLEEVVPEASDAFAKENLGYNTWSEYVIALYSAMNKDSFYEQITESLMASSTVENYPQAELAIEKQRLYDYYYAAGEYYGSYYGMDAEMALMYFFGFKSLDDLDKWAEESAYEVVKNNLVLVEISKVEQLSMDEAEYQNRLSQMADYYGYGNNIDAFVDANGEDEVKKSILLDYVMSYIVSQATIIEADYDAVVQPEE